MPKAKRAALYLRVSTDNQSVENQRRELTAIASQRGWQIVATYSDEGVSGAKGRDERPGLNAMLRDATRGKFDVVMCWSVDRIGRSLSDLVNGLQELHTAGCDLFLAQQAIDTTTPAGKAMYQMLGVFSEFERSMIVARVNAGIARARESGTKSGNPFGRPKVSVKVERKIREELSRGSGVLKTARLLGVGTGTVQRVKAAAG